MRWYYFPLPALIAAFVHYRAFGYAPEYSGTAQIIDGDTIEIGSTRIRLHGIDAPESRQVCTSPLSGRWALCGREATTALAGVLRGAEVRCRGKDKDRYGRVIAVCYAGGQDVNAWLVEKGWAIAYRRYSQDYVDEEQEAREAKVGIWAGQFIRQEKWRRGRR